MNGNPNWLVGVRFHCNNDEDEESQVLASELSSSDKLAFGPKQFINTITIPSYNFYSSSSVILRNSHEKYTLSSLKFRSVLPRDREQIEQLHLEWFPVVYRPDFFDSLVYGQMPHSDEPLFTHLAVRNDDEAHDETIVACVVGSFVDARILSESTRNILIDCVATHPRLFYIMTVGTNIRGCGLGSYMIQKCIEQVERDPQCGVLYLHVLPDNYAAISMYEKLGFYFVQEIPNYYTIDNELRSCYLYAKYFHGNRGHRAYLKLFQRYIRQFWKSLWTQLTPAFSLLLNLSWSSTPVATTDSNNLLNNNRSIQSPAQS